jgi:hypothetical protein
VTVPRWLPLAVALALAAAFAAPTATGVGAVFTDAGTVGANDLTSDVLDPPTNFAAFPIALIRIDFAWTATPDAYAEGYHVYRATSAGGPYVEIAEVTPRASTAHSDSPGIGTFYYRVRAYAGSWESVGSATISCVALALAYVCV